MGSEKYSSRPPAESHASITVTPSSPEARAEVWFEDDRVDHQQSTIDYAEADTKYTPILSPLHVEYPLREKLKYEEEDLTGATCTLTQSLQPSVMT